MFIFLQVSATDRDLTLHLNLANWRQRHLAIKSSDNPDLLKLVLQIWCKVGR